MEIKGYLIRDVFQAKPGKARELVEIFKSIRGYLEEDGFTNLRIMTDYTGTYWTVVLQSEVKSIPEFDLHSRNFTSRLEVAELMKGYMDLVQGGHREMFKIH